MPGRSLSPEQAAAVAMVGRVRQQGLELTGPDGLLERFTKNVLETALNEEMTEHLGHEPNRADTERGSVNTRNGTRTKTVISDAVGEVEITVPRDRGRHVRTRGREKRQRRLSSVDEVVLSLYAKGMTTGEISAHFSEMYGASVSKDTISRIADKVIGEMDEWSNRPLESVYCAVFIDAIPTSRCGLWRSLRDVQCACSSVRFAEEVEGLPRLRLTLGLSGVRPLKRRCRWSQTRLG